MACAAVKAKDKASEDVGFEIQEPARKSKYERLLLALSQDPWRQRVMSVLRLLGYRDEQWIRVVMQRETQAFVEEVLRPESKVLEISGLTWQQRIPPDQYSTLEFPEFDICQQSTDEAYDLILIEQVLEHVLKPAAALKNIEASLSRGGHVLVTTPFMVRYHGHPYDCSRWTETGMREMLLDAGFEADNIQTGSWGNKACLLRNLGVWQRYNPIIHSLENDPRFPLMVWAMAKKTSSTGLVDAEQPEVCQCASGSPDQDHRECMAA